jgi:hypothetical protein
MGYKLRALLSYLDTLRFVFGTIVFWEFDFGGWVFLLCFVLLLRVVIKSLKTARALGT